MPIKKQVLKTKSICKVSFELPSSDGLLIEQAEVLGTFNNWTPGTTPFKKSKNGIFKANLELPLGQKHAFRYLVNGQIWLNDPEADDFAHAGVANEKNSLIVV